MKIFMMLTLFLLLSFCSISPDLNKRETYYVKVNNAYLPVYTLGSNTEKVILFVHGGPGLSSVFYYYIPFFQKLAKKHKIFFWDQRGAGGTRGFSSDDEMTINQFVHDIDVVYNSIKLMIPNTKIYVMGHSYGGMVGGSYVTQYDDKVEASIFIEPAFNVKQINEIASELMLNNIIEHLDQKLSPKEEKYWNIAKIFYTQNKYLSSKNYLQHSKYTSDWDKVQGLNRMCDYIRGEILNLISDSVLENLSVLMQMEKVLMKLEKNGENNRNLSTDSIFGLSKITKPVLLVTSELDYLVPPSTSIDGYNRMNGGIPNRKSVHLSYKDASHAPFLQSVKHDLFDKIIDFIHNN